VNANWKILLLIGYEQSQDGTLERLNEWKGRLANHPQIRLSLHDSPGQIEIDGRLTGRANIINLLEKPHSSVATAFCDCDDIWESPRKLQLQMAILAENSDVACVYARTSPEHALFDGQANLFWRGNSYCFSSLMARSDLVDSLLTDYKALFFRTPLFDWALAASLSTKGKIFIIDKPLVRFGFRDDSSWHSKGGDLAYRSSSKTAWHLATDLKSIRISNRLGAAVLAVRFYCFSKRRIRRAVRYLACLR
jgi:hypothetical protein